MFLRRGGRRGREGGREEGGRGEGGREGGGCLEYNDCTKTAHLTYPVYNIEVPYFREVQLFNYIIYIILLSPWQQPLTSRILRLQEAT